MVRWRNGGQERRTCEERGACHSEYLGCPDGPCLGAGVGHAGLVAAIGLSWRTTERKEVWRIEKMAVCYLPL